MLHDVLNGGMDSLPTFLDSILERGITLEQDFPDYLVPIDRGVITDAAATILPQGVAL